MNKLPIFSLFVVSVILVFVFGINLSGAIVGWFLLNSYSDISMPVMFWSFYGEEVIKFLISVIASAFFYRKLKIMTRAMILAF